MKIAYLSTFQPFRGGISQFNAALYRALEQEHDVKAYNFTRQYPEILFPGSTQYITESDTVDMIPNERILDTVNPFTYLSAANKIKRFKPEMLLMKFWMPFFAPSLGTVSYLTKKKTKIISILDNAIPHERRPGDITLTKYFLNQNHGFVVMSDAVKNDLLSLNPKANYIYHPHPLYDHFGAPLSKSEACKKLGIDENKKTILFFGFIRDYKGLDILLEAFSKLDNSYQLIVAGEVYGDFKVYQDQVDALNIGDRTILHVRYISDNEVPLFFSAADVSVLPYKSATQSGITAIAYHFNLPVIATDVGGLKETIKHKETGIIVDKPEAMAVKQAIETYFREDVKAQYQQNIERLKDETSWKHLADSIAAFSNTL